MASHHFPSASHGLLFTSDPGHGALPTELGNPEDHPPNGDGSKAYPPVVHIKIAGKWMCIPQKMVCIGIDP